jgi:hypothetical protein
MFVPSDFISLFLLINNCFFAENIPYISQLIVRLSFFFWPLYCLFFDLEMILITSLIASNFSWTCLDMSGLGWTLQTA